MEIGFSGYLNTCEQRLSILVEPMPNQEYCMFSEQLKVKISQQKIEQLMRLWLSFIIFLGPPMVWLAQLNRELILAKATLSQVKEKPSVFPVFFLAQTM